MTPIMMMEKLQEYLQEITEEMFLGPLRLRPNVYKVDLPARATPDYDPNQQETDILPLQTTLTDERDERWPFIIVTFTGPATDEEDLFRTVPLDLLFGCEGTGPNGYMDVLHLMEYVRASFLRETWEGWSFRLTRPLTMGLHDEQADPFWTGYMSTTWETASIEQEVWKNGF